jgi:hypothetical protein
MNSRINAGLEKVERVLVALAPALDRACVGSARLLSPHLLPPTQLPIRPPSSTQSEAAAAPHTPR